MDYYKFYFQKFEFNSYNGDFRYDEEFKNLDGYFIVEHKFYNEKSCAFLGVDNKLQQPLKKKLSELFPSIKFNKGPSLSLSMMAPVVEYNRFCFKFDDPADEAAFMMYHNVGFEIEDVAI